MFPVKDHIRETKLGNMEFKIKACFSSLQDRFLTTSPQDHYISMNGLIHFRVAKDDQKFYLSDDIKVYFHAHDYIDRIELVL